MSESQTGGASAAGTKADEVPAAEERDVLLDVRDVTKHFASRHSLFRKPGGFIRAVDGVSFTLKPGEVLGLVGESGSGKSTVAKMISGSLTPTDGKITLEGRDVLRERLADLMWFKKRVQMVFQDPTSSLNPRRTVGQSLELPLAIQGLEASKRKERVADLLQQVELDPAYAVKYPHALSGGQKQRVAIARALAMEPRLLILDEPTSALDVSVQAKMIHTLSRLQHELGLSYLFISHDLSLMRNVARRTAVMYLGKIVEFAPTDQLFRFPLHPYTRMLLSAIPVVSTEEEALRPTRVRPEGEIPSPVDVPSGCAFHPRCSLAVEGCRLDEPELLEVEPGHWVRCPVVYEGSKTA